MKKPRHLVFPLAFRYACLAIGIFAISRAMSYDSSFQEDDRRSAAILSWLCVAGFIISLVIDFFRFRGIRENTSLALLLAIISTWIFIFILGQFLAPGINALAGLFIGFIFLIDALLLLGIVTIDALRLRAYIQNRA
jgi:hypothetical protein